MPDCIENCPVSARVESLEKEFDRYRANSSDTHREMFHRLNDLEQSHTAMDTKLDGMDKKLDKLVTWRDEQDSKPNRLIDHLKENAINYIMLALLALLLFEMGIAA